MASHLTWRSLGAQVWVTSFASYLSQKCIYYLDPADRSFSAPLRNQPCLFLLDSPLSRLYHFSGGLFALCQSHCRPRKSQCLIRLSDSEEAWESLGMHHHRYDRARSHNYFHSRNSNLQSRLHKTHHPGHSYVDRPCRSWRWGSMTQCQSVRSRRSDCCTFRYLCRLPALPCSAGHGISPLASFFDCVHLQIWTTQRSCGLHLNYWHWEKGMVPKFHLFRHFCLKFVSSSPAIWASTMRQPLLGQSPLLRCHLCFEIRTSFQETWFGLEIHMGDPDIVVRLDHHFGHR